MPWFSLMKLRKMSFTIKALSPPTRTICNNVIHQEYLVSSYNGISLQVASLFLFSSYLVVFPLTLGQLQRGFVCAAWIPVKEWIQILIYIPDMKIYFP